MSSPADSRAVYPNPAVTSETAASPAAPLQRVVEPMVHLSTG
jgi:hypothetical protein